MGDYVSIQHSETLEANEMQMRKDVSDLNGRDIPLRLTGPTARVRAAECDTCTCTDTCRYNRPKYATLDRISGSYSSSEQKPSRVGRNKCLYSLARHCPLLVINDLFLALSLLPTAKKPCVILWTAALYWIRENFHLDVLLSNSLLTFETFSWLVFKTASSCENWSLYPLIDCGMYK